jgi:hypothetical protein
MPKGWRDWFRRVSERKARDWELSNLNQCLTLSLSGMERNEPLLISASYFWSNALNAFIFGQSPMTITLADIHVLTGLKITESMQPYELLSARSKRLAKILDCTGWAMLVFINTYRKFCKCTRKQWLKRFIIHHHVSTNLIHQLV